MKKEILMLLLGLLIVGCTQNDIAVYEQEPRLNLPYDATYTFTDRDYLNKTTKAVLDVQVELMGDLLDKPLAFCLQAIQDTTNVKMAKLELSSQYTFEPNRNMVKIPVGVECPKELGVLYSANLVFNLHDPGHQFGEGTVEKRQAKIGAIFNIRPKTWNDYFGIYSNAKYTFMMDHWKQTYEAMPNTGNAKIEISDAYNDYKKNHGPLYDDQKPKQEIVFPL